MNSVYYNGKIYVERGVFADAMLVSDGLVQKVGTFDEVTKDLCPKCEKEMIDLEGKTVIPGFNDTHSHTLQVGDMLRSVELHGTKSLAEVIERGQKFVATHNLKPGDVIFGLGWNQDYFADEVRMPNRYDLDKISTEFPVVFVRACVHIVSANSKALEIAGIKKGSTPVEGGVIYFDENGEPTGVMAENQVFVMESLIPAPTPEKNAESLKAAMQYCASMGITSVQTMDINGGNWQEMERAYKCLYANYPQAIRMYQQAGFLTVDSFKDFLATGRKTGYGNDMFKYGPLKMLVDGSLGARTALLSKPYSDDANTCGVEILSQEFLNEMVKIADDAGVQVVAHAIGDKAIDMLIKAYENVIVDGNNKNRHGIVHFQITTDEHIERMVKSDILALVQPIFIDYDMNVVADRVGQQLADTSYAFGDLIKKGVHVSYGTDAPVEDYQPFYNLYCAVTRKNLAGTKAYRADQCVDIYTAIDAYTIESAYVSFEENKKGRLLPGYFADFAVLDRDIFTIPSDEIKDVQCVKTVVGGNVVFER